MLYRRVGVIHVEGASWFGRNHHYEAAGQPASSPLTDAETAGINVRVFPFFHTMTYRWFSDEVRGAAGNEQAPMRGGREDLKRQSDMAEAQEDLGSQEAANASLSAQEKLRLDEADSTELISY